MLHVLDYCIVQYNSGLPEFPASIPVAYLHSISKTSARNNDRICCMKLISSSGKLSISCPLCEFRCLLHFWLTKKPGTRPFHSIKEIFTLRVKALQAGELLCGSMVSPVVKQLCRLAAELEQEAEDKNRIKTFLSLDSIPITVR
jgi:hypothetical protein